MIDKQLIFWSGLLFFVMGLVGILYGLTKQDLFMFSYGTCSWVCAQGMVVFGTHNDELTYLKNKVDELEIKSMDR